MSQFIVCVCVCVCGGGGGGGQANLFQWEKGTCADRGIFVSGGGSRLNWQKKPMVYYKENLGLFIGSEGKLYIFRFQRGVQQIPGSVQLFPYLPLWIRAWEKDIFQ